MSASVRPAIPRPRPSAAPAPARSSSPPPSAKTAPPPRPRIATLDLEDGDILGVAVPSPKTEPPPLRKSTTPPARALVLSDDEDDAIERGWDDAAAVLPAPAWEAPTQSGVVSTLPAPPSVAPPAPIAAPTPSVAPPAPIAAPTASIPPPPASMARPVTSAAQPGRLTMSDPTDLIFDGMYGLTFARSTGEAAEMCAETLAKALGARTVVIHAHDLTSRELRAIGVHGDGDFDILGSAEPSDDDLVGSAVICNQKSVSMTFDGELPRVAPKRLQALGAPRTLVAAPVMSWGRCLAIIEIIDADERFAGRVADSAAYVAEHLAKYILAHAA